MRASDLRTGQTIESIGGPTLTVYHVSYGHAEISDVLAGTATAVEATATEDGRPVLPTWQIGPGSGHEIYFERFGLTGRRSHGWVDAETRQIVQTG